MTDAIADRTAWADLLPTGLVVGLRQAHGRQAEEARYPIPQCPFLVDHERILVRHECTAVTANQLWLIDNAEHRTGERKL